MKASTRVEAASKSCGVVVSTCRFFFEKMRPRGRIFSNRVWRQNAKHASQRAPKKIRDPGPEFFLFFLPKNFFFFQKKKVFWQKKKCAIC